MTNTELENRISALEAEVSLLKSKIEKKDDKAEIPWWEQRVGVFADDPIYDEAMRLGREYRESQKLNYDEDDE